jgi:hypothetical protein
VITEKPNGRPGICKRSSLGCGLLHWAGVKGARKYLALLDCFVEHLNACDRRLLDRLAHNVDVIAGLDHTCDMGRKSWR